MNIACYILIGELYLAAEDERRSDLEMQFASRVGRGHLSGTIVLDYSSHVPDIKTEGVVSDLPLGGSHERELLIAAFGARANVELLEWGDIHVPLGDVSAWLCEEYKPLAAARMEQQLVHALRIRNSQLQFEDGRPWHFQVTKDLWEFGRRTMCLCLHHQPTGLELVGAVTESVGVAPVVDGMLCDDFLLPNAIVGKLLLHLHQIVRNDPHLVEGNPLRIRAIDFEGVLRHCVGERGANGAMQAVHRAMALHEQAT